MRLRWAAENLFEAADKGSIAPAHIREFVKEVDSASAFLEINVYE